MNLFGINSDKPFIRYMGGKQYAAKKIMSYAPPNLKHMVSPFIGGGSVELYAAANMGIRVEAYDNLHTLVRHWNIMLTRAGEVMRTANKIFPVRKHILKDLVVNEKIHDPSHILSKPENDVMFAAIAMCMTRQGFNGYYMKTSYFRDVGDPVLARFEQWDENFWDGWQNDNLSVECQDWEITFAKHKHDFLFCDPPYIGLEDYYGQYETRKTKYKLKEFDHEYLAEKCADHRNGIILTYQDDEKGIIRSLYDDPLFDIIETSWHQGSRKSQGSEDATELIILKAPAMSPNKRNSKESLLGNPKEICRCYGGIWDMSRYSEQSYDPETLCGWLEITFSALNPEYPPKVSMESLLRVPYGKYSCTKSDVYAIIKVLLERGIIEKTEGSHKDSVYYGYPSFVVKNMNEHIKEMRAQGIPIKAVPHFSYDYDETA